MSKDSPYERLRELSWRRKLTPAEQAQLRAWLATHPEDSNDWDMEQRLTGALQGLPDVPVASNFTARVLDAAAREIRTVERGSGVGHPRMAWWRRWLPQSAFAAVVVVAGLLSYHHVLDARRAEVAQSLTTISQLPAVPRPEVLQDFDTIAALSSTPPADEELLRIMQ